MDTRHRILADRSLTEVGLTGGDGDALRVIEGTWTSAFTGETYVRIDPLHVLDVDHLIPVCWAWEHGAADWTREQRRDFYNDEALLVVVESGRNRSKGAKGVMEFVPASDFNCDYVSSVLAGLIRYNLDVDAEDMRAMRLTVAMCSRADASASPDAG